MIFLVLRPAAIVHFSSIPDFLSSAVDIMTAESLKSESNSSWGRS